uniref:Uncharacterized protein n=1 Tax=Rhizophora mucronata TaxID=61149 RepID=A0A2P2Q6T8_RHIMU
MADIPIYYLVASCCIKQGKRKEAIQVRVLQPVVNIKNLGCKEFSRNKLKVLGHWHVGKYLDFVESTWPCYCRTMRLLKKANLI